MALTHFQQNVLSVYNNDEWELKSISDIAWILNASPMSIGRSVKSLVKRGYLHKLRTGDIGDELTEFKYHLTDKSWRK